MEKWMLWLLLEAATMMVVASLWLVWRGIRLRQRHRGNALDNALKEYGEEAYSNPIMALAKELNKQANQAIDKLKELRNSEDIDAVTRYKLWGTLAKAERSILLNDALNHPQPVLNRFMESVVTTLENLHSRGLNQHTLTQNIRDIDAEFIQASELLISKEQLIANQKDLHDELNINIDRANQKITSMELKAQELQRLSHELEKLRQHVKALETHGTTEDTPNGDMFNLADFPNKHQSSKHLEELEHLSIRQQGIIEHLQAQIEDEDKTEQDSENEQAREQALHRMERLSQESHSLVQQLQNELRNTNITISALRDDISSKDAKIKELDNKIKAAEGGVLGGFQTLNTDKRSTLESIIGDINTFKQSNHHKPDSFANQEREVANLEQMLKESEVCVQLLVQEVDSAETENEKLKKKLKYRTAAIPSTMGPQAELNNLREQNRLLVSEVHDMQETMASRVSNSTEKSLRNEYNKKNLELDRLQLAYSDLERKYLGAIR